MHRLTRLAGWPLHTLLTLLIGGAGAAAFAALGLPAAILTGPATCVTLAGLAGVPVIIPVPLRNACFLVIGISIGSAVTPEVLQTAMTWPLSLVVLTLTLIISLWLCRRLLERGFGMDRMSALLAATPGHLSFVLGLSADLRADLSRVAVVQSIRVLLLTLLVPAILTIWGVSGGIVAAPVPNMGWVPLGAVMAGAVVVGWLFERWRVPAAYLLGGMAVSGLAHVTELTPGILPPWISIGAFIIMGCLIGTRFRGLGWADLRKTLWAGVVVTLIACTVATVGAVLVAWVLDLEPAMLLIAFAPGGVEVMAAMAVQIGVEPTFVAAHHVLRLLVLTALLPYLLVGMRRAT